MNEYDAELMKQMRIRQLCSVVWSSLLTLRIELLALYFSNTKRTLLQV